MSINFGKSFALFLGICGFKIWISYIQFAWLNCRCMNSFENKKVQHFNQGARVSEMGLGWKWWGKTRVYWVMLGLHVLAILLFTKGFLLTRTELPYYSQCSDVSQSPCFYCSDSNANLNQTHQHQHCWTKPAIGRLVVIVLDALRLLLFPYFVVFLFFLCLWCLTQ